MQTIPTRKEVISKDKPEFCQRKEIISVSSDFLAIYLFYKRNEVQNTQKIVFLKHNPGKICFQYFKIKYIFLLILF